MTAFEQLFMYTAIILGVYFSNKIREGESSNFSSDLVVAGLAALLVMPVVFDKVRFKENTPILIRFALYFQSGVFADAIVLSLEQGGL